ncbi:DUF2158 domain-containing protein [Sinorhizobium meliloti]|uniref:DUF2158 domain-containing protein n=1 Tax=Rhizobium meliloti TaxID=382 RepID=A0AAW9TSE1_RHIML|nr:DUF2158 domain-containing protein [Sinorhizobium meliloti]MQW35012.1 DUF2158 domain-containing protein [Sinorhizobium meliloti]RVL87441.1 DUF2158 domain-containing protein [Sinorhizobium meliloti]
MNERIRLGEIVQLKSGGPKLTVNDAGSSSFVWTSWFAGSKNERARFHVQSLQTARDEPQEMTASHH